MIDTLATVFAHIGDEPQTPLLKTPLMFWLESFITILPALICLFLVHKNGGFPPEE